MSIFDFTPIITNIWNWNLLKTNIVFKSIATLSVIFYLLLFSPAPSWGQKSLRNYVSKDHGRICNNILILLEILNCTRITNKLDQLQHFTSLHMRNLHISVTHLLTLSAMATLFFLSQNKYLINLILISQ